VELIGPRLWFIPLAVALVSFELLVLHRRHRRAGDGRRGFSLRDSLNGAFIGAGGQAFGIFFRLAIVYLTALLAPFAVVDGWPPVLELVVAVVSWDLLFYWFHRLAHRTAFGWASHITHHESRYFNLSVALRLEWFPFIGLLIYPLQGLLGLSPDAMAVAVLANAFYGGLIHTETVGRLPRPIEAVMNTPWHHRVHHERAFNGGCNFANTFIVWDRLFGTYRETEDRPYEYGVSLGPAPVPLEVLTPLHRFWTIGLRPVVLKLSRGTKDAARDTEVVVADLTSSRDPSAVP
jgi:sterol desaturase/sphingolipid hydroxylase (fatty acid hydroxylase superfamily)